MKKFWIIAIFILVVFLFIFAGLYIFRYAHYFSDPLPPAVTYDNVSNNPGNNPDVNPVAQLLEEVNLAIPFTPQAPHQNWDLPYQHMCEETSALMAAKYLNNDPIAGPDDVDKELLAIKDFEEKRFGYYKDTNAEETATILREYFDLEKVEILEHPQTEDIKKALASGRAVLVPVAGRQIGNPFYLQPGPIYHMIVIKGYNKSGDFITNDPGTRRGADFIYDSEVIMKAIHDWTGSEENIESGRQVVIIVG